jgi:hypothetical protein
MPHAIDMNWTAKSKSLALEDAGTRQRMAARIKRDHATVRAMLDDIERACRAVEEGRPGCLERFRQAASNLSGAFEEHLAVEAELVVPILRTADAWGEQRATSLQREQESRRRSILALAAGADQSPPDTAALVSEARSLVDAFERTMDSEERSLDDLEGVPTVVPDQEDG